MSSAATSKDRSESPTSRRRTSFAGLARSLVLRRLTKLADCHMVIRERGNEDRLGSGTHSPIVINVHDPRFWSRVARKGGLGAAEAWMRGWWSCEDLVSFLRIFVRNIEISDRTAGPLARLVNRPFEKLARYWRRNTLKGSARNIHAHYDVGNDFFALFLDESLTYSAAIRPHPDATLHEASLFKLDRILDKTGIERGQHLLEVGTGWGSLALRAAQTKRCRVTTTTISREQSEAAEGSVAAAGLGDHVSLLREDYRNIAGSYDHIVSIEMIEAVGHEYLPQHFQKIASLLRPGGRLVMQAIAMNEARYERYLQTTDFIREYVFPGSCCAAVSALVKAAGLANLRLAHIESFDEEYAWTLRQWRKRFHSSFPAIRALGYDDAFCRLWDYYLCYCEAGFLERNVHSVQLVFVDRREPSSFSIAPAAVAEDRR